MSKLSDLTVSRRTALVGTVALSGATLAGLPMSGRAAGIKTLRIASGEGDGVKGTLDPAFGKNDPDSARLGLVYEKLVRLNENFAPEPQLATEWSSNAEASVWTFKLRPGVVFHDGSPFTAKDVLFGYGRLVDPKLGSPGAATFKAINPEGIKALDEHTVEFHLPAPVVEFPLLLTNRFGFIVRDGQTADQLRTAGVGTGAFKVEHYVPGEEPSTYVKHQQYWQPGKPGVDRVELRSVPEESARIAALLSGQIDIFWDLPLRSLKRLEGEASVKVVNARTPFWYGFAFWSDTPPYDDPRVRLALKLVADREQLLKAVLAGHGSVASDNPVAPWLTYAIQDAPRTQDIAKAKALLAEAGHPDGIDIDLHTSEATSGLVELATAYKAQAAKAGIRVNLVKDPADDYWANIWLKKPAIATCWSGRAADEALALPFLSDAEWNETHWRNSDFDAAVAEARRTTDVARRAELYGRAQRLVRDDGGAVIALFGDAVGATRSNISGWKLHPQKISQSFVDVTVGDAS